MNVENVQVVKRELASTVELVKRVIAKYRDRYPTLWENYTLVLLLCERESGIWISPDAIESAARGTLPKLNTLDRALRVVKKLYQSEEARKRSSELESAYASVLGGDWGSDTLG